MNIKQSILYESGMISRMELNEMAAKELNAVMKMILSNDIKGAAAKYVEMGGSPSSSGISKTVNSFLSKNADLPDDDKTKIGAFREEVVKLAQAQGIKSNRAETYKTGVTGTTKSGEKTLVSGQSQKTRNERINDLLGKHIVEYQKEKKILYGGSAEDIKKLAKEVLSDLKFGKEHVEDKEIISTIDKFVKTGEGEQETKKAIGQVLDAGEKVIRNMAELLSGNIRRKLTPQQEEKLKIAYEKIGVKKGEMRKQIEGPEAKKDTSDEMPLEPDQEEPDTGEEDEDDPKVAARREKYWPGSDENKWKDHSTLGTSESDFVKKKFGDLSQFKNLQTEIERVKKGSSKKRKAK